MRNKKFKYIVLTPQSKDETKLFREIEESTENLYQKLLKIKLSECGLSEYNQRYLKDYLDNFIFYAGFYTQVLIAGLKDLSKPANKSVFIDYGGGSGFFSLLAKEFGFKTVIYNDIYNISVSDAKIIANETEINIDHFICGDIDELAKELDSQNIQPDIISSFEVIEHIYNLDEWFKSAGKIKGDFGLVFSSSANIKNPYIVKKLKKKQLRAELKGSEKTWGAKKRDSVEPFLHIRKRIISNNFPQIKNEKINELAKLTRGFNKEDILKSIKGNIENCIPIRPIAHPTNTCDPLTGNRTEHLINHNWLKKTIQKNGFVNIEISPALYTNSEKPLFNFIKFFFNVLIRILGKSGLRISPLFILKARKS